MEIQNRRIFASRVHNQWENQYPASTGLSSQPPDRSAASNATVASPCVHVRRFARSPTGSGAARRFQELCDQVRSPELQLSPSPPLPIAAPPQALPFYALCLRQTPCLACSLARRFGSSTSSLGVLLNRCSAQPGDPFPRLPPSPQTPCSLARRFRSSTSFSGPLLTRFAVPSYNCLPPLPSRSQRHPKRCLSTPCG
jgi:hypothetical protein